MLLKLTGRRYLSIILGMTVNVYPSIHLSIHTEICFTVAVCRNIHIKTFGRFLWLDKGAWIKTCLLYASREIIQI